MSIGLGQLLGLRHRTHWGNPGLLGLDLFALASAVNVGGRNAWLAACALICVSGLAAWAGNTRRQRLIQDVPTSRIASAAQGYVELSGRIAQADAMLLAKLSQTPCVWFRYRIEDKDADDHWRIQETGESDQIFLLRDASGACAIDPVGAEINTRHKSTWTEFDRRYTEYLLLADDDLYALGEFATIGPDTTPHAFKREVSDLLATWKSERGDLLQRFDANQDGEIDLPEWESVRAAAEMEIHTQQTARATQAPVHRLSKPSKRPFLLSNLGHEDLSRRYRRWAWAHLAMFLAGCGGLAYWSLIQA
jgi:hypothetical protein